MAIEIEDAAKVAKETVHGQISRQEVNKIQPKKRGKYSSPEPKSSFIECIRCGRVCHNPKDCRFKNTICHYCNKIGHIEAACLKKKKESAKLTGERNKLKKIFSISQTNTINKVKVS